MADLLSPFKKSDFYAEGIGLEALSLPSTFYIAAYKGKEAACVAALEQATGLKALSGRASHEDSGRLLWCAANAWLWLSDDKTASQMQEALSAVEAQKCDLSHARVALRLSGKNRWNLLAKSVFIDFSQAKPGQIYATTVEDIATLIHIVDEARLDLYVTRSLAQALWDRLEHAAREWG